MSGKNSTGAGNPHLTRIAWLAWLVVPLALATLLFASKPLAVLGTGTAPVAFAAEEEEELEEAGLEEEWCDETEVEEGCEEDEEAEATDSASPGCLLRSANAHAATKNDRLRLTIGYTTSEPFDATVEIKQGATRLGSLHRHLGRSGVIRFSKQLGEQRGRLIVRIKLPKGRAGCPSRRLVLFPR